MAKLILTHEVSGLGSAGDVIEVKNGYARNYLIPQKLAIAWTRGGQKQVDQIKNARASRELHSLEAVEELREALEKTSLRLPVKVSREGRLFGSVQSADIAQAVKDSGIGEIDKRKIQLGSPIKTTGRYTVHVRLHEDIVAQINLQVVAAK